MGVAMKCIATIKQSRGAVAPLVAIMLVLIVVCVALVVDLGHIHNVKVQLQRAADAAALAGAQELIGTSGASTNGRNVAVASALSNTVDQDQVVIDPDAVVNPSFTSKGTSYSVVAVQPIRWDPNIVDPTTGNVQTTNDRITPLSVAQYDTANGLWVTAQRNVNHVFFFFTGSTQVTADAIAVAEPFNPVLPLAIISCIPTDQVAQNPGDLPGMTVCDIKRYSFNNDQNDTSAWTSLTFNVSANEVKNYMEAGTGREQFNQVIYGRGLAPPNFGIENTAVDSAALSFSKSYTGCQPDGLIIPCGLGRIAGKDIARWDEFPIPSTLTNPLNKDLVTGVYSPTSFDPMTGYGANGALPRWYNLNPATGFQHDDHFTRLWSQDGVLLKGASESFADYQLRLQSYREDTVRPFTDDRFVAANPTGGNSPKDIIKSYTGGAKNTILNNFGIPSGSYSSILFPDFSVIPEYAGYPKVYVFNGVAGSILSDFLDNPEVLSNGNLNCRQDVDLPQGQHALVVNVPVIFAGACDTWQALSLGNNNFTMSYVGMSKFLMTRAWRNPDDYDCGSNFVDVNGCDISAFDPPPGGGNLLSAVDFNTPGTMEGVSLYPISDDQAAQASLLKVFLVE
jgi:Flp pilus assembly protein TadG